MAAPLVEQGAGPLCEAAPHSARASAGALGCFQPTGGGVSLGDYARSFATTLCDSVIGHWTAMCARNATIAHMTRTKSHHYNHRAAGLGWMPPSNLSGAAAG